MHLRMVGLFLIAGLICAPVSAEPQKKSWMDSATELCKDYWLHAVSTVGGIWVIKKFADRFTSASASLKSAKSCCSPKPSSSHGSSDSTDRGNGGNIEAAQLMVAYASSGHRLPFWFPASNLNDALKVDNALMNKYAPSVPNYKPYLGLNQLPIRVTAKKDSTENQKAMVEDARKSVTTFLAGFNLQFSGSNNLQEAAYLLTGINLGYVKGRRINRVGIEVLTEPRGWEIPVDANRVPTGFEALPVEAETGTGSGETVGTDLVEAQIGDIVLSLYVDSEPDYWDVSSGRYFYGERIYQFRISDVKQIEYIKQVLGN